MPSGTATMAASTKPPNTRHTVMPMSWMKLYSVKSSTPSLTIVTGLARKVGETKPPSVKKAQTTTKSTKKPRPSSQRARALTGSSGASARRRRGAASTAAGRRQAAPAWKSS